MDDILREAFELALVACTTCGAVFVASFVVAADDVETIQDLSIGRMLRGKHCPICPVVKGPESWKVVG